MSRVPQSEAKPSAGNPAPDALPPIAPEAEGGGELIARLRAVPRGVSEYGCQNCDENLKAEAADAIVALMAVRDGQRATIRGAIAAKQADKARLDWLETHTVEVRDPLVYGSRHVFFASPDDSVEGEEGPSDIRAKIDRFLSLSALSSEAPPVVCGGDGSSGARAESEPCGLRTETLSDLERLAEIAGAATPGPWFSASVERPVRTGDAWSDSGWPTEFVGHEILGRDDAVVHSAQDGFQREEDAEFAAAFDPPTVLRLIALATPSPEPGSQERAAVVPAAEQAGGDETSYALLGTACEGNGLAGFGLDGEMWFQPPPEAYAEEIERLKAQLAALRGRVAEAAGSVRVFIQDSLDTGHDRAVIGNLMSARDLIDGLLSSEAPPVISSEASTGKDTRDELSQALARVGELEAALKRLPTVLEWCVKRAIGRPAMPLDEIIAFGTSQILALLTLSQSHSGEETGSAQSQPGGDAQERSHDAQHDDGKEG